MTKEILSGVLLLDKPEGMSSNDALFVAKKRLMSDTLNTKKAGHTGTLDPMATGLLPICFGAATAFARFGLDADKGYQAHIRLGAATDTGDRYGQITQTAPIRPPTQAQLNTLALDLLGVQMQTPPMYSALKKDGKKLYEYARMGLEVERCARQIEIFALQLQLTEDPNTLFMQVRCSKGTYVRVLAEQIAELLGTFGHLTMLRRTQTAGLDIKNAYTLEDIGVDCVLPIDVLMVHLPILYIDEAEHARLKMGQRLNVKDRLDGVLDITTAHLTKNWVRLYGKERFVGVATVALHGRLQPIKMVS